MEGETYDWAGAGFLTAMADTVRFYRCLLYFLFGGTYKECPYFTNRLQVRVGKPVFGSSGRPPPSHSLTSSINQSYPEVFDAFVSLSRARRFAR